MKRKRDPKTGRFLPNSKQQLSLIQKELHDPLVSNMLPYLSNRALVSFSEACKQTQVWTSYEREKREKQAASALLLTVVKGNEAEAKRLLTINPGLLRSTKGVATNYANGLIRDLTPFQAALCGGDVEMCEMMKKYFVQLKDGKAEMEKQFNDIFPNGLDAYLQTQRDNVFDFNEILQAINCASDDEVTAALNREFDCNLPLHRALDKFRKKFTETSLLEIVFNPYHLLQTFQIYDTELAKLKSYDKRYLFSRQVIGFVQRYLPACYLQAFAQGIYEIVIDKEKLRRSFDCRYSGASLLPLQDSSDLGFEWACNLSGWPDAFSGFCLLVGCRAPFFQNYVDLKHQAWKNYLSSAPLFSLKSRKIY